MADNNVQENNTVNEVSSIKLPDNSSLTIKDAQARTAIDSLLKIYVDDRGYISINYGEGNS